MLSIMTTYHRKTSDATLHGIMLFHPFKFFITKDPHQLESTYILCLNVLASISILTETYHRIERVIKLLSSIRQSGI